MENASCTSYRTQIEVGPQLQEIQKEVEGKITEIVRRIYEEHSDLISPRVLNEKVIAAFTARLFSSGDCKKRLWIKEYCLDQIFKFLPDHAGTCLGLRTETLYDLLPYADTQEKRKMIADYALEKIKKEREYKKAQKGKGKPVEWIEKKILSLRYLRSFTRKRRFKLYTKFRLIEMDIYLLIQVAKEVDHLPFLNWVRRRLEHYLSGPVSKISEATILIARIAILRIDLMKRKQKKAEDSLSLVLEEIIALSKDNINLFADTFIDLIDVYLELGDFKKTDELIKKFDPDLKLNLRYRNEINAHYAKAYARLEMWVEAMRSVKSICCEWDHQKALYDLIRISLEKNRIDQAESFFQEMKLLSDDQDMDYLISKKSIQQSQDIADHRHFEFYINDERIHLADDITLDEIEMAYQEVNRKSVNMIPDFTIDAHSALLAKGALIDINFIERKSTEEKFIQGGGYTTRLLLAIIRQMEEGLT